MYLLSQDAPRLTSQQGACVLTGAVARWWGTPTEGGRRPARQPGAVPFLHPPSIHGHPGAGLWGPRGDRDPAPALQEPHCQWSQAWALPLPALESWAKLVTWEALPTLLSSQS